MFDAIDIEPDDDEFDDWDRQMEEFDDDEFDDERIFDELDQYMMEPDYELD